MSKTYLNTIGDFSIKLPFKLNDQQLDALDEVDKFIKDNNPDNRVLTIMGWAGTGKTTMMEIVYARYWTYRPILFAATTHKAAAVLKSKVGKKVYTVNSLFGIMIEYDLDGNEFDASKKKRTYADKDEIRDHSIIIIDEASMLSEDNYKDVIEKSEAHGCKIIFIGDPAQLAPVNEGDISIVFRDKNKNIELTKVERTDDVPILEEATKVRIEGELSYSSKYEGDKGVRYITTGNELIEIIDKYIDGLKTDPNYFRILTYTNNNVEKLNSVIRKKLGYGLIPEPGEPLMSYSNWGYHNGTYRFLNSESYTVDEIISERKERVKDLIHSYCGDLELTITDMYISDAIGTPLEIPYIDVRNNPVNYEACKIVCYEKVEQWRRYKDCETPIQKGMVLKRIKALDELLFVNDNIYDQYGNLLQAKVVDFGYVHTIHKSQGCTFGNVLLNDIDISNKCGDEKIQRQLRYVGLTRAKDFVAILTNHIN
jgi:ATP-dependent exoDNAse (exonuclease V) alpha subunit